MPRTRPREGREVTAPTGGAHTPHQQGPGGVRGSGHDALDGYNSDELYGELDEDAEEDEWSPPADEDDVRWQALMVGCGLRSSKMKI